MKKTFFPQKIDHLMGVAIFLSLPVLGYFLYISYWILSQPNKTDWCHTKLHSDQNDFLHGDEKMAEELLFFDKKTSEILFFFDEKDISFVPHRYSLDDASCLNRTPVFGVVQANNVQDVVAAISYAKENQLAVSVGGQRHTMGGQTFASGAIYIDTNGLQQISIDAQQKIAKVQAGVTRKSLQQQLQPYGLAVKAMQSINIFSVGGTIGVNAHGLDPLGPIAHTIKEITIVDHNGDIQVLSPDDELFGLVVGGYGLYGIVVAASIEVVDNSLLSLQSELLSLDEFFSLIATPKKLQNFLNKDAIELIYARVSLAGSSAFDEVLLHRYTKFDQQGTPSDEPISFESTMNRFKRGLVYVTKNYSRGQSLRRYLEKHIQPSLQPCLSRNEAMSTDEDCIIVRNVAMADDMKYLRNKQKDTDILQEYFLPPETAKDFLLQLQKTVHENNNNLLNISIRFVQQDKRSFLPYATHQHMVAFVLYFNHDFSEISKKNLDATTSALIDAVAERQGTFYLPYRLVYTPEQLQKVYPSMTNFWKKKEQYDPDHIFVNTFYTTYYNQ